ncbi:hypothetical protein ACE6H2_008486 [Prunus campanulata]
MIFFIHFSLRQSNKHQFKRLYLIKVLNVNHWNSTWRAKGDRKRTKRKGKNDITLVFWRGSPKNPIDSTRKSENQIFTQI